MCLPGHIRHCEPVAVRRSIDRRGSCPGGRYQDLSVGTESRLRGAHGRRYAVSLCMCARRRGNLIQQLRGDHVLPGRFVFHSPTRVGRENRDVFGKRKPLVCLSVGGPECPCEPLNLRLERKQTCRASEHQMTLDFPRYLKHSVA